MIDVQIFSTATNYIAQFVSLVAGASISAIAIVAKTIFDNRRHARRLAHAVRAEISSNLVALEAWVKWIEDDTAYRGYRGVHPGLPKLRYTAIEAVILSGSWSHMNPMLERHVNVSHYTCQLANDERDFRENLRISGHPRLRHRRLGEFMNHRLNVLARSARELLKALDQRIQKDSGLKMGGSGPISTTQK